MAWIVKLTEIGGGNLYVNLDQIVSFVPARGEHGEGTRLRTTLVDQDGKPVEYAVLEGAEKVYDTVLAGG